MFEPCFITSFLCGTIATTGVSAQEYVKNYCKVAIRRHKQMFPRVAPAEVIAAVNLSTSRLLRLDAKLWGQIEGGSFVWLVTSEEWKQFSDSFHSQEDAPMRYGRKFIYKNPSYLSSQQLADFIAVFCSLYKFNIDKSSALNVEKQDVCSPNVMNTIFDKNIATPVEPIFQTSAAPTPVTPASETPPAGHVKRSSISSTVSGSPSRRRSSKSPRNSFHFPQDTPSGYVAKHDMMSPRRRSTRVVSPSASKDRLISPKKSESPSSRGAASPSALTKLFPQDTTNGPQVHDMYEEGLRAAENAGVQTYGSLRIALGSEYSTATASGQSTPSKSVRSSITTETTETSDTGPVPSLQSYIDSALRAKALSESLVDSPQQYWDPDIHNESNAPVQHDSRPSTPTEAEIAELVDEAPDQGPPLLSEESNESWNNNHTSAEVLLGDDECPAMEKEEVASVTIPAETKSGQINSGTHPKIVDDVLECMNYDIVETNTGDNLEERTPSTSSEPQGVRSPGLSNASSPIMAGLSAHIDDFEEENVVLSVEDTGVKSDAAESAVNIDGASACGSVAQPDIMEAPVTLIKSPKVTHGQEIECADTIVDNPVGVRSVYASDDIAASVPRKCNARKPTRASYTEGDERQLTPREKGASTLLSAIESLRKSKSEKGKGGSDEVIEEKQKGPNSGKSVIPLLFPRQTSPIVSPRDRDPTNNVSMPYCFVKGGAWVSRLIMESDEFYRRILQTRHTPEQLEEAVLNALMNMRDNDFLNTSRSNVDSLTYSSPPDEGDFEVGDEKRSPRYRIPHVDKTCIEQLRQDNSELRAKVETLSTLIENLISQVRDLQTFVPPSPPRLQPQASLESIESVHPFDSEADVHESPKKHRSKSVYLGGRKSYESGRRKRRESFREFTPHISLKLDDIVEEGGNGETVHKSPEYTVNDGIAMSSRLEQLPVVSRVDQSVSPICLEEPAREMCDQGTMTEYEIEVSRSKKLEEVPVNIQSDIALDERPDEILHNCKSAEDITDVPITASTLTSAAIVSAYMEDDANSLVPEIPSPSDPEVGSRTEEAIETPTTEPPTSLETPSKTTRSVQFFDAPSPISDTSHSVNDMDRVVKEEELSPHVSNHVVRLFLPFLLAFEWQEAKQLLQKQQTVAALANAALAETASKAAAVTQSFQHEMQQRIISCIVRDGRSSKGEDEVIFRRKSVLWAVFQHYAKSECSVARYITYTLYYYSVF